MEMSDLIEKLKMIKDDIKYCYFKGSLHIFRERDKKVSLGLKWIELSPQGI